MPVGVTESLGRGEVKVVSFFRENERTKRKREKEKRRIVKGVREEG